MFYTPAMIFDLWDDGDMSTSEALRLLGELLERGDISYETHDLVVGMILG